MSVFGWQFHTRNKALNGILYKKELAANSILGRDFAVPTPERACDDMLRQCTARWRSSRQCYPRCFGLARVEEARLWESGVIPFCSEKNKAGIPYASGFLLEYIDGLEGITKDMITAGLAEKIKAALATIHALNIRHNDLESRCAFPDVAFANLFIKSGTQGG